MLLTRIARALRRIRSEEDGAGMAMVVGLLAVSLLTTSLVASSVISATEYTTISRAGVQSQAAAEAGIADARAGLLAGTCATKSNRYASANGVVPRYVATVWVPSGSGWARGCPPGTATQVRILSTGYAAAPGVNGGSGRDVVNIEVILSATAAPTQIAASGPAIYAWSSSQFGAGGKFTSVNGSTPNVMVYQGDVTCDGGATGIANLVAQSGSLTIKSSCYVTGNAFASGRVNLPEGRPNNGAANLVEGSVVGAGVTLQSPVGGSIWSTSDVTGSGGNVIVRGNLTAASVNFSNGGVVGGNTQVSGLVKLSGGGPTLNGTLRAGSVDINSSSIVKGRAWIFGTLSVNWGTKFQSSTATTVKSWTGPTTNTSEFFSVAPVVVPAGPANPGPLTANPTAPTMPTVPNWVDFTYDQTKWTGFASVAISNSGICTFAQVKTAVESFAGQPGVLDARNCIGGISLTSGDDKLPVNADLAIISNKFNLNNGGSLITTTTVTKRVWLITPDTVADQQPTCPSGSSLVIDGGFKVDPTMNLMVYTPCKFTLTSGTTFRGQIFGGQVNVSGGPTLGYVAVGLPGVDLDTGSAAASSSSEADRTIVSYRNVQAGN